MNIVSLQSEITSSGQSYSAVIERPNGENVRISISYQHFSVLEELMQVDARQLMQPAPAPVQAPTPAVQSMSLFESPPISTLQPPAPMGAPPAVSQVQPAPAVQPSQDISETRAGLEELASIARGDQMTEKTFGGLTMEEGPEDPGEVMAHGGLGGVKQL